MDKIKFDNNEFKNLLPKDIEQYSPKMLSKLPIKFWEETSIDTIISISIERLDELDFTKIAEIISTLRNRNFKNETDRDSIYKFIELIPGKNLINQLEIEVDSETISEINKLTAKDVKKYSAKDIAELPIYFWKHISFDAIHKISKTQLNEIDKFQLDQIRKIVYSRFSNLKNRDYYSLINRIQYNLMIIRRTSAPNIYIGDIEYISKYKFYKLLRYSTVPEYSIMQRIEDHLETYFTMDSDITYYSIRSCVEVLNKFYYGPEKESLKELPNEFLTIKEAMGILGFSQRGRETLNARIGCYKVGRFPEDVEDSENPNKAKKTLFLIDDVKKYAYQSNRVGMLRVGVLDEEQVDDLLSKRYSSIKESE